MSNSRISSKLLGGKAAKNSVQGNALEFDPRMLTRISLNRDTVQALTLASAEVKITIGPGGTLAQLHEMGTGRVLGGMDDLTKLLGLRAFVAKEKKQHASSEIRETALVLAMRAFAKAKEEDDSVSLAVLDNAFMVAMRPYKLMADKVNERYITVKNNRNDASGYYKILIECYLKRMEAAIGKTITQMVLGKKEKGLLDSFLMELGVPSYIKTKLTSASLVLDEMTDLSKLIFTQDPTKGLSLTLAEWRDESFRKRQGSVLQASRALGALLSDDNLVMRLTGLDKEVFENAEDPRTQRVMKTRITVVPQRPVTEVLRPLSRENSRGWGLPSTNMDRPGSGLSAIAAVFLCAYCHTLRVAELIPDFYDRVYPKGTVVAPDEKRGNLPAQALRFIEGGGKTHLQAVLEGRISPDILLGWINRECKIIPGGDLSKQIEKILTEVVEDHKAAVDYMIAQTKAPAEGASKTVPEAPVLKRPVFQAYNVKLPTPVISLSSEMRASERESLKVFKEENLLAKAKKKKVQRSVATSALARETRTFLKQIRASHGDELCETMESYFRGFMSRELQIAGVELAEGRFDEMDELSDAHSSEEDSDDE